MFIRLLFTSIFLVIVVQSAVTNTSEGQPPTALASPKQASLDEDYDLIDKKSNAEGSGAGANLDDYADEDEDQLSKITMISSSTFTTTKLTTSTKIPKQKNENITKKDDADANEFNDDYKDDLADDVDYNEITTTNITSTSLSSTLPSSIVSRPTPIRILFGFLTRPPIAAGVLAGESIFKKLIFF
jgi:hypothetical protein